MGGTILPSLPPLADDHMVTVCGECYRRRCIIARSYRQYCKARQENATAPTAQLRVEILRSLELEHPSYWRAEADDDPDMPKSIEDVRELAAHRRGKETPGFTPEENASMFGGYLTEQLGLDRKQCRDILRDVWPEAAAAIDKWLPETERAS